MFEKCTEIEILVRLAVLFLGFVNQYMHGGEDCLNEYVRQILDIFSRGQKTWLPGGRSIPKPRASASWQGSHKLEDSTAILKQNAAILSRSIHLLVVGLLSLTMCLIRID